MKHSIIPILEYLFFAGYLTLGIQRSLPSSFWIVGLLLIVHTVPRIIALKYIGTKLFPETQSSVFKPYIEKKNTPIFIEILFFTYIMILGIISSIYMLSALSAWSIYYSVEVREIAKKLNLE